jgi:hypothetical protein
MGLALSSSVSAVAAMAEHPDPLDRLEVQVLFLPGMRVMRSQEDLRQVVRVQRAQEDRQLPPGNWGAVSGSSPIKQGCRRTAA